MKKNSQKIFGDSFLLDVDHSPLYNVNNQINVISIKCEGIRDVQ